MIDNENVISVIIPIFNVEAYLRKCLDSIINQSYSNLEILLIDDGSTDNSGHICDNYKVDERVRVFHIENSGLSCARNLGLDEATGQWIGFVDADDWVEPDMYETLLTRAKETGADIVECGYFKEYQNNTVLFGYSNRCMTGYEAIVALLQEDLFDGVWNKIYKRKCFNTIRFPENRIFEEYATTYRVFGTIQRLITIESAKYHYLQRKDSLSRTHEMKSLIDYWKSHYERYENLYDIVDNEARRQLLKWCSSAVARTWAYYYDNALIERKRYQSVIIEMNDFSKRLIPLFGYKGWSFTLRIAVSFPHYFNGPSFRIAWFVNRLHHKNKALLYV